MVSHTTAASPPRSVFCICLLAVIRSEFPILIFPSSNAQSPVSYYSICPFTHPSKESYHSPSAPDGNGTSRSHPVHANNMHTAILVCSFNLTGCRKALYLFTSQVHTLALRKSSQKEILQISSFNVYIMKN